MRRLLLLAGIVIAIVVVWRIIRINPKSLKQSMMHKLTAADQDRGIQAGARKTFSVSLPEAWAYLVSTAGVGTWLGIEDVQLVPGRPFTNELVQGEIQIVKDFSHIRMAWKRTDWSAYSTLQVRVFMAISGTTISFHQDKLPDEGLRKEMLLHWENILGDVGKRFRLSEN